MAVSALGALRSLTGDGGLMESARSILAAMPSEATRAPEAFAVMIMARDRAENGVTVIVDGPDGEEADAMSREALRRFLPGRMLIRNRPGAMRWPPALDGPADVVQARVCGPNSCLPPARSPEELGAALDGIR